MDQITLVVYDELIVIKNPIIIIKYIYIDPTTCENYKCMSLLSIAYKVLTFVLCKQRLKPLSETQIVTYQCWFRYGKSTINQILTLPQILENIHEKQIDTHHLFVDYKVAFNSPEGDRDFAAMSELSRLCRMTLSNFWSFFKVAMDLSEPFDTVRGFRQGDPLSCDFFDFVMENVLRKAGVHCNGIIFQNSIQLLADGFLAY